MKPLSEIPTLLMIVHLAALVIIFAWSAAFEFGKLRRLIRDYLEVKRYRKQFFRYHSPDFSGLAWSGGLVLLFLYFAGVCSWFLFLSIIHITNQ